jgi:hypothetical protein
MKTMKWKGISKHHTLKEKNGEDITKMQYVGFFIV